MVGTSSSHPRVCMTLLYYQAKYACVSVEWSVRLCRGCGVHKPPGGFVPPPCGDDERAPYPSLWCHGTVRPQALRRQPIIHVHLACASAMPLAPQLALVVARAGAFPQPLICPKRRFRPPCHLRSVDHMPALVQTPCLPVYLRESLQVVKTRLQLSGELRMVGAQQYSGSFQGG